MEQLLVNLHEMGARQGDLTLLPRYCELTARACGIPIPGNQPFVGRDVYRTAAGVHAAAIRKALQLGDDWVAERVYAGVPASRLGRAQRIDVGPGSGRANILAWLEEHLIEPTEPVVAALERAAHTATRIYADDELHLIVASSQPVPLSR
jgi:2-isopropylmalate synthase